MVRADSYDTIQHLQSPSKLNLAFRDRAGATDLEGICREPTPFTTRQA